MSDFPHDIWSLVAAAEELPPGATQVSLLEEAVRLADLRQDLRSGFDLRLRLCFAAFLAGLSDVSMAVFGWCLGQYDRDPRQFDVHHLLHEYQRVLWIAADLLSVTRAQIDGLLADLERRLEQAGYDRSGRYHTRLMLAHELGDVAGIDAAHDRLKAVTPGHPDSNLGLWGYSEMCYLVFRGRNEDAAGLARRLVHGGVLDPLDGPRTYGRTCSYILLPLVRLGRVAEAMDYYRLGHRLLTPLEGLLYPAAKCLLFLALTENLRAGRRLFERVVPAAVRTAQAIDRFMVFHAAAMFVRRVRASRGDVRVRLPAGVLPESLRLGGPVPAADLAPWVETELAAVAAALDRRNGNSYYAGLVDGLTELETLVTPYPLRSERTKG